MVVTELLNNEKQGGFTHKVEITHADLTETTVNTAQTIQMVVTELGSAVQAVGYVLKEAFEDASDSAFNSTTVTIGDSDVDRFMASKQLNVNGTEVLAWMDTNAVNTFPYVYLTGDTIDMVFTSMSAKALSNIDTGKIWVYLNVVHMAR